MSLQSILYELRDDISLYEYSVSLLSFSGIRGGPYVELREFYWASLGQ